MLKRNFFGILHVNTIKIFLRRYASVNHQNGEMLQYFFTANRIIHHITGDIGFDQY